MTLARLFVFLAIITTVMLLVHLYVWKRVVKDARLPRRWHRGLTIALFALAATIPLSFLLVRDTPREFARALSWVTYTWLGLVFYLFVYSLAGEFVRLGARLWGLFGSPGLFGKAPRDPDRRAFLGRMLAGGAGAAAVLTGAAGIVHANHLRVRTIEVPLKKLPPEADGFVIAQISDLHVGPLIGRGYVERVVNEINALSPGLVAITGDLVDGSVEELGEHAAALAGLKATHGVYFVTGNHEYYSGPDPWIAWLKTIGIRTLRNERVDVGGLFELAGTDDHKARGMAPGHGEDVEKALSGRDPSKAVVLLAHQPKTFREALVHGVDLQLSGHVHGGQMAPFNWLVHLEQPYLDGLHREGDSWIYVSPGTGFWGPPMRVGTTSEITRVVLRAS